MKVIDKSWGVIALCKVKIKSNDMEKNENKKKTKMKKKEIIHADAIARNEKKHVLKAAGK